MVCEKRECKTKGLMIMLLCDGKTADDGLCTVGCHVKCANLKTKPKGAWYCSVKCEQSADTPESQSAQYYTISSDCYEDADKIPLKQGTRSGPKSN